MVCCGGLVYGWDLLMLSVLGWCFWFVVVIGVVCLGLGLLWYYFGGGVFVFGGVG